MKKVTILFNIKNKKGEGYIGRFPDGRVVLPAQKEHGYYDIFDYIEKKTCIIVKEIKPHQCTKFENERCIDCGSYCFHEYEITDIAPVDKDDHRIFQKCKICGHESSYCQMHHFEVDLENQQRKCRDCGYTEKLNKYEAIYLSSKLINPLEFKKVFQISDNELKELAKLIEKQDFYFSAYLRISGRKAKFEEILKNAKENKVAVFVENNTKEEEEFLTNYLYISWNVMSDKRFYFVFDKDFNQIKEIYYTLVGEPLDYDVYVEDIDDFMKHLPQTLHNQLQQILSFVKKFPLSTIEKFISILSQKEKEFETYYEQITKEIESSRLFKIHNTLEKYLPASVKFTTFVLDMIEETEKAQRAEKLLAEETQFPENLVLHFLKHSAKQLTESEIDYTTPLYGQEEELCESGNLRWKLEISIIDEDFVEWERAITNAGEIRDSKMIQKLQDMAMFAILKNIGKRPSLPAFVEKEIMKNIEKPAPISYYDVSIKKDIVTYDKFSPYGDLLPTGRDFISEEQEKEWKKEQEKIVKEKAEQAKKEVKPIIQENEYIKVIWKPEVKSGVGTETIDLEKGRGFATYLVAFVTVVWKAEVTFKIEVASDVKEVILQKFHLDI